MIDKLSANYPLPFFLPIKIFMSVSLSPHLKKRATFLHCKSKYAYSVMLIQGNMFVHECSLIVEVRSYIIHVHTLHRDEQTNQHRVVY